MGRYLPRSYVAAFADPDDGGEDGPVVWVHRPIVGIFQRAPADPVPGGRHFNQMDDPAGEGAAELERLLEGVEAEAARIAKEDLPGRAPLGAPAREALATFAALLGMRLSPGFRGLDEGEVRGGYGELREVVREMGWVFWECQPPDYFVTSSAPFHVAFPGGEEGVQALGLRAPPVEITLPLGPRLALHATWKRRGELWRRATEDVLLEVNARTILRAREFVLAPKPAIPG